MSDVMDPGYWSVIPWPVLHSLELSDKTKLVYGVVASLTRARQEDGTIRGYCYASNATLAEIMGCGERTITRAIADLADAGELIVQHVGTPDNRGNRQRRIYTLESYARGIVKTGETASFGETGIDKSGETFNRIDKKRDNNTPKAPTGGDGDVMFERFWHLYPRKTNKQAARRAWNKLKPDLLLCSQMSQALKRQIASEQWLRDGGRYIPHPSTWLNGRRWEDETFDAPAQRPPDGPSQEAWGWQT